MGEVSGLFVASNTTSLGAQFQLQRNMNAYTSTLTRLSTGLRINSAKDDPAGMIASELLKSDIIATNTAISNTQRANSVLAIADSALGQISSLLNDIRGLVVESANVGAMSTEQIEANQLQVDASLDAIDRISRTTNYQGKKLLDGSQGFQLRNVDSSQLGNLVVNSANFGSADQIDVTVTVDQAAKKGTLLYYGTGIGSQTTSIDVTGSLGTKSLTFGPNSTNEQIAAAINAAKDSTGVQARVEGASQRGQTILHSVGKDNDIVITALNKGQGAGDYTFEIVSGGVTAGNETVTITDRHVTITVEAGESTAAQVIAALNAAAASGSGTALEGVIVAAPIMGDTGSGTVMAMNAANVYGNVNDDNAIQFIGMSTSGGFVGSGPNAGSGGTVVRLIAGKANDSLHHYIRMVTDTDLNDIAAGLKSGDYVLEVYLATDGAGNSITTAKDLAAYFDREDVKAQGTNGISAEVYYPDGVDPNWRVWEEDACGNVTEKIVCGASYGNGIIQPTQRKENECELVQADIFLLQANESLNWTSASLTVSAESGASAAGLRIDVRQPGTPYSGWEIQLVNSKIDDSGEEAIRVRFDDTKKWLVIEMQAASGETSITAENFQKLLNGNGDFQRAYLAVTAPDDDIQMADFSYERSLGIIGALSGSYTITTDDTAILSGGIAMHGQSDSNERLVLEATEYGSANFVQITVGQGKFDTFCPLGLSLNRLAGTDIVATINGYQTHGQGTHISVNTADLSMDMDVKENAVGSLNFSITGGGAIFQLGPDVKSAQQIRIALPNMSSTVLGGPSGYLSQLRSGGEADMFTDTILADRIVNEAIVAVTSVRGRIGATQKATLDPNISSLQDNVVALSEALAIIEDADFAAESSNLARYQILVQAGANVLAQANQIPQYAAMLIG